MIFFIKLIEKSGLAASWIKTLFGLNFFKNFRDIIDESDLSLPPLIIIIFLENFFLIFFGLSTTNITFLKSLSQRIKIMKFFLKKRVLKNMFST